MIQITQIAPALVVINLKDGTKHFGFRNIDNKIIVLNSKCPHGYQEVNNNDVLYIGNYIPFISPDKVDKLYDLIINIKSDQIMFESKYYLKFLERIEENISEKLIDSEYILYFSTYKEHRISSIHEVQIIQKKLIDIDCAWLFPYLWNYQWMKNTFEVNKTLKELGITTA